VHERNLSKMAADENRDRMLKNRRAWDLRTLVHLKSEFYDLDSFKSGRNSLLTIEQEELGDVRGRSLLHLQCHFGMDTLSWARLGARVTGADFSEEAITAARSLAAEVGLKARFICANLRSSRSSGPTEGRSLRSPIASLCLKKRS
jgi:2-polyprenyl-3-methyl-5-hydroxy-6-metoxy-1,4-benzoquinol methylase